MKRLRLKNLARQHVATLPKGPVKIDVSADFAEENMATAKTPEELAASNASKGAHAQAEYASMIANALTSRAKDNNSHLMAAQAHTEAKVAQANAAEKTDDDCPMCSHHESMSKHHGMMATEHMEAAKEK